MPCVGDWAPGRTMCSIFRACAVVCLLLHLPSPPTGVSSEWPLLSTGRWPDAAHTHTPCRPALGPHFQSHSPAGESLPRFGDLQVPMTGLDHLSPNLTHSPAWVAIHCPKWPPATHGFDNLHSLEDLASLVVGPCSIPNSPGSLRLSLKVSILRAPLPAAAGLPTFVPCLMVALSLGIACCLPHKPSGLRASSCVEQLQKRLRAIIVSAQLLMLARWALSTLRAVVLGTFLILWAVPCILAAVLFSEPLCAEGPPEPLQGLMSMPANAVFMQELPLELAKHSPMPEVPPAASSPVLTRGRLRLPHLHTNCDFPGSYKSSLDLRLQDRRSEWAALAALAAVVTDPTPAELPPNCPSQTTDPGAMARAKRKLQKQSARTRRARCQRQTTESLPHQPGTTAKSTFENDGTSDDTGDNPNQTQPPTGSQSETFHGATATQTTGLVSPPQPEEPTVPTHREHHERV